MLDPKIQILDAKNISTLSIKVTEQIHKKYLYQFLRTNILNTQKIISKNSYFYYSYMKRSSTYEILVYEKNTNDIILEPFIFNNLLASKPKIQVYITDTYFILMDGKTLLCMKKISTTDKEDVTTYIKQMYNIEDFEVNIVSSEELNDLKSNSFASSSYNEFLVYEDKSFSRFILFLLISIFFLIIFLIYSFNEQKNENNQVSKKIDEEITLVLNKPLNQMSELFKYIEANTMYTKDISFVNRSIEIILYDSSKENLLKLVSKFKNKLKVKSLVYSAERKIYSMEISIEN